MPVATPAPDPDRAVTTLFERRTRGKRVRAATVLGVYALSFGAFVDAGLAPADASYAALQIFALGWDLAPPPEQLAQAGIAAHVLQVTRVLGPLVLAELALFAALVAGIVGRPQILLRDHVVVLGAGNLGRTLVEHLLADGGGARADVVVVDREEAGLRELAALGCWTVQGDAALPAVLVEARVRRARAVVAVTNDDITNVAALLNARALGRTGRAGAGQEGGPALYAHVEDARLAEMVRALVPPTEGEVINTYEVAAQDVVADVRRRGELGLAVVVGCGKLGGAIRRELGAVPCVVVDKAPECAAEGARHVCGDVRDPAVLRELDRVIREERRQGRVVVFLATDQDVRNLDMALRLRGHLDGVELVTRVLRRPPGHVPLLDAIGMRSMAEMVVPRFGGLARLERPGPLHRAHRALVGLASAVGIT